MVVNDGTQVARLWSMPSESYMSEFASASPISTTDRERVPYYLAIFLLAVDSLMMM